MVSFAEILVFESVHGSRSFDVHSRWIAIFSNANCRVKRTSLSQKRMNYHATPRYTGTGRYWICRYRPIETVWYDMPLSNTVCHTRYVEYYSTKYQVPSTPYIRLVQTTLVHRECSEIRYMYVSDTTSIPADDSTPLALYYRYCVVVIHYYIVGKFQFWCYAWLTSERSCCTSAACCCPSSDVSYHCRSHGKQSVTLNV